MALVSCSKDKDLDTNPLVGTWLSTETFGGVVYLDEITFNSDHTGTITNKENGIQVDLYSFTWSTSNNIITLSADGETNSAVYAISGNKLTIDDVVYTRK